MGRRWSAHLHAGAIKDHYVLEYDWDVAENGTACRGTSCAPRCSGD